MRVLIMAGGTGGHIFPALATATDLQNHGCDVAWLGTRRGMEARLVPAAGIPIYWIRVGGVRGKGLATRVLAPFKLLRAVASAIAIMHRYKPAVVLGMGGYASGPGGLAAWLLRCPLLVHEQNAVPGLTNRVLAHWARRVFEAFPDSFPAARQAQCVGNPVRAAIAALPTPSERFAHRAGRTRVLVIGGSQGARILNQTVAAAVARLDARPDVWHQAGAGYGQDVEAAYKQAGIEARVTEFIDDMAEALAWADCVVCRAGALTVSELAAVGVGSVLVPFAGAVDDHQTKNAARLVNGGAATMIAESDFNATTLAQALAAFVNDRPRLLTMAEAARKQARTDAAYVVSRACREIAQGGAQ